MSAVVVLLAGALLHANLWSYSEQDAFGPSNWHVNHAECAGSRQSPIRIEDKYVRPAEREGFLKIWIPTRPAGNLTIRHDQDSVVLDIASRGIVFALSSLMDNMLLTEVRLHTKAEHLLHGRRHQAEAHFVFVAADESDLPADQQDRGQKVIVAVLFDESASGNGFGLVKWLIENSASVPVAGSSVTVSWSEDEGHDLRQGAGDYDRSWLDFVEEDYYEYDGSTTAPPCEEVVRWMVVREVRYLNPGLLSALENTINKLGGNSRPVQPANGRRVTLKSYAGSVGRLHESEFVELSLVAARYSHQPVANVSVFVAEKTDEDFAGLIAAIVILSLGIAGVVVAAVATIIMPVNDGLDEGAAVGDRPEDEEEGSEEEEEDEEDEENDGKGDDDDDDHDNSD
ncbi:Bifunctional monodehydroascorbate reductase and carbonic anhydrase nectarin-3 [Diplonema papillatum]|nr:Bifunctional monodehydroascorbate reductase and carbonic anhydrase nectarin-3 [Diplonema papillatum]